MNTKLIFFTIILIFLAIYRNQYNIETYSSNYNINKSFINIKEPIRSDLSSRYIHNLSKMRSEYLYNLLFNLNNGTPIYLNKDLQLKTYIENVCFVKTYKNSWYNNFDYNLSDGIIEIINDILKSYFDSEEIVDGSIKINDYIKLLKKCMKIQLKTNILKYVNYNLYFLDNKFFFDHIIDIIIENQNDNGDKIITDFVINDVDDKKLFKLQTKKNYDDFDILFEGIDQTLVNHINNKFKKSYSTILNLSLNEIKNLYYSGEINNYDFSDKYCK